MPDKYVMSLDIGTSRLRCLIIDLQGHIQALAEHPCPYHAPPEITPLGKEFDPRELWQMVCQLIGEAMGRGDIAASDLVGVSCASQREGLALLDREGRELYLGPNTDLRAFFEGVSLDSQFGAEVYGITGHTPSFMFAPAKLRWFQVNRPEIYERIATVLPLSDWLTYKLSGERACELSAAAEIGLLDFRRLDWSRRLVELLDLPAAIYPPLGQAGSRVGQVSPLAAAQTGLPQGMAVSLAGADTQCGLLGMGVVEEGEVGVMAGWSASAQMATAQPMLDAKTRTWSSCHVAPQRWIVESCAGEAGGAYSRLRDVLFPHQGDDAFAAMDELAQGVSPGAEGALAFLGPYPMDMGQVGLKLGGFLMPIPLSAGHRDKAHLVRAALENLCFALKACLGQLEEVTGAKPKGISLGGGLSRSQCLAQMLADVLGEPVSVAATSNTTGLGAALCAAVGAGLFPSLEAASEAMAPRPKLVSPDPTNSADYPDHYQRWLAAWQRLSELSRELL